MVENLEIVFSAHFGHFDLPKDPTNIPERLFNHFGILDQKKNGTNGDDMTKSKKEDVGIDTPGKKIDYEFGKNVFVFDIINSVAILDDLSGGMTEEF